MIQVLHVYKEVALLKANAIASDEPPIAIVSYDEKPEIQAIKNIAPDWRENIVLGDGTLNIKDWGRFRG